MNSLRRRGWTRKLIETLLGEPITMRRNPYFYSGPMMRCYNLDQALEMEADSRFQLLQIKRGQRRHAESYHDA
jgi:hypothetical protein